jgi:phosphoglycerate dehydrogenase-like enzyme
MKKVLFTDYDMLDISLERKIFADAGIELVEAQCRSEDEVIRLAEGCSALLVQYAPVGDKVFAARPEIGLASRIGAGYDTIDARAAARHGVWVANSPDYGVGEVSLHALSMMLSIVRNIARYDRDIHSGTWHYTSPGKIPRAQNLTVGVLGLGRIGKRFAHYAQPIFKRVIAHDPYLIDGDFPQYVERVSIERLFGEADAISIHCLLNDETRGMVGERLLSLMKPGSYLVNTARGAIVDIDALVKVLKTDRLAGVALDVLPITTG